MSAMLPRGEDDVPDGLGGRQVYTRIRADCLRLRRHFTDDLFPPEAASLGYAELGAGSKLARAVVWRRPHEICKNPEFIVDDASRFDLCQGEIGDCWFLAALASLTLHPRLLERVLPSQQSFSAVDGYAGIFRFRFWQYGKWVEVVIDDRLPTVNGKLLFVHSQTSNEFWSALLEKAYAKLCGSYEAMRGGMLTEAFMDFTGGLTERRRVGREGEEDRPDGGVAAFHGLWDYMRMAQEAGSLMGASTYHPDEAPGRGKGPRATPGLLGRVRGRRWFEKGALGAGSGPAALGLCCGGVAGGLSFPNRPEVETKEGIVLGHAYSVTGVEKVIYRGQSVELVRLRNPWGCVEWSGDWSDRAPQWNEVDPRVVRRMRNALEDGEFWMFMGHFRKNFHTLDMCHLTADDLAEGQRHRWAVATHAGEWRRGHSAGGTCQHQDTYRTNPQYRVRILAREGGEVLLTLLQKPRDLQRNRQPLLSIGFLIHQIPKDLRDASWLPQEALTAASSVGGTATWSNLREVGGRFRLPYGDYVVVPCTFQPNEEAEFILRIFAQRDGLQSEEMGRESNATVQPRSVPKAPEPVEDATRRWCRDIFQKYTAPNKGIMDPFVLQNLLTKLVSTRAELGTTSFSLEGSRRIVGLKGHNGQLGLQEFTAFWTKLKDWTNIFVQSSQEVHGSLSPTELSSALQALGRAPSSESVRAITARYADARGRVGFEEYVCCLSTLTATSDAFGAFYSSGKATANGVLLSETELLRLMLCC
ncbi:calpain-9-like isoform X1 [Lampetra planeri]